MNIHNELYILYREGAIGSAEVLTAYSKGFIDDQSCNVILGQQPSYTLDKIIYHKNREFNYFCTKVINEGIDVELSDGSVKHFSLSNEDQLNINTALTQIMMGATEIEYHADGGPFVTYSAEDMSRICTMGQGKVLTETAYRNNLREWIKQLTDIEEIRKISYGTPIPEEYWTEGWRSIQEKITAQTAQTVKENDIAGMSEEQHSEETPAEEQPKENIVSKAINAVTGKSRKKKATSEETIS